MTQEEGLPIQRPYLAQLLKVYGGIKEKSYRKRVRTFEWKLTERATEKQAQMLLQVAKGLME